MASLTNGLAGYFSAVTGVVAVGSAVGVSATGANDGVIGNGEPLAWWQLNTGTGVQGNSGSGTGVNGSTTSLSQSGEWRHQQRWLRRVRLQRRHQFLRPAAFWA